MDDETPRCAVCEKKINFVDVAAIDMQMVRGRVIDDEDDEDEYDEDDEEWTYGLHRAFCSEEHFREWARAPLLPMKEWDDWTPAEGDLTGCALIFFVGGLLAAIILGLAVYGTVQAILAIT